MIQLPVALQAFANYRQFIVWGGGPGADGSPTKLPLNHMTGYKSDPHDPSMWLSVDEALSVSNTWGDNFGIAFVLTEADPFWFLDIDHCLKPEGSWSDIAIELCNRLAGAAIEISVSGDGLHIYGTGNIPEHGCRYKQLGLELYHAKRTAAITGNGAVGNVLADCTTQLAGVINDYFPPTIGATDEHWTDYPVPEWNGTDDDAQLIERAVNTSGASSAFTGKATFRDLWERNEEALAGSYPADSDKQSFGTSEADRALAQHLAFWTGKNCERMQRIMWLSGLVREKWTKHKTYLQTTILTAIATCATVYTAGGVSPTLAANTIDHDTGAVISSGFQYKAPIQQIDYFKGCVYVRDLDRVMVPDGELLRPGQFKATYGGHVFALDSEGDKTTRNAWEAFTESQVVSYPIAHKTAFYPDKPSGEIFELGGRVLVNNYVPINIPRKQGDAAPFFDLLQRILPVESDRQILVAYMAACVQHKGFKFQWIPLLQGVEGNGKTLFSRCVAEAVGMRYVQSPRAEKISDSFNAWMKETIFFYVEDVYYPHAKQEIIEALKPIITNNYQSVEPKGVDSTLTYVVANGMLNSNHKDGVRKTRNDRRFAVFYTAQQNVDDLKRDGMDGNYFPNLYNWFRAEGYAIVAEFLNTYNIPDELNPATSCMRAPITSSTDNALIMSMGTVEQTIIEAVEECQPGFANGWVSSTALERLLESKRMTRMVPINKRRDLMTELGYDWHPGLRDGRVNNPIPFEGSSKPRLYIRRGHISSGLTKPAEISKAYIDAQNISRFTVDMAANNV